MMAVIHPHVPATSVNALVDWRAPMGTRSTARRGGMCWWRRPVRNPLRNGVNRRNPMANAWRGSHPISQVAYDVAARPPMQGAEAAMVFVVPAVQAVQCSSHPSSMRLCV